MNRSQLLETAALDVLGLLEPDKRERFEIAFGRAAPDLKAEVRRVQDVMLGLEDTLPDVEPDARLRHRVVTTVGRLIEHDLTESRQQPVLTNMDRIRYDLKQDWVERLVAGRVSPMWRIAALVFITLGVMMGYMAITSQNLSRDYASYYLNAEIEKWFTDKTQFGRPMGDLLYDSDVQLCRMTTRYDDTFEGKAALFYLQAEGVGVIAFKQFPEHERPYKLYVGSAEAPEGERIELASFMAQDSLEGWMFDVDADDLNAIQGTTTWWVMGPTGVGPENTYAMLLSGTM